MELKQLLEAGLLTPSQSPWASPLLIIQKKDGDHFWTLGLDMLTGANFPQSSTILKELINIYS